MKTRMCKDYPFLKYTLRIMSTYKSTSRTFKGFKKAWKICGEGMVERWCISEVFKNVM